MMLLMFTLALLIALAQEQLVSSLKNKTQLVKKWGGRILIVVGLWLMTLAIWADFFAQIFPV